MTHPTKKVLGKFKDECNGKIITEFIALKPKMYCYKTYNEVIEEKKAKGAPKKFSKKGFEYERLLQCFT